MLGGIAGECSEKVGVHLIWSDHESVSALTVTKQDRAGCIRQSNSGLAAVGQPPLSMLPLNVLSSG